MSDWFYKNKHLYPWNWDSIAKKIKDAAGWVCEACGHPHGPSPHVLTVDHFDHNPKNNDPDNLIPLCQRCHLRRQGLYPPAKTRAEAIERLAQRAKFEASQLNMFEELPQ